jgi:pimeloyl-ACP methyl ester carboxylesterase
MSIVALENDLIHYEVLGRGRPLIFLHGWVGSWRYWIPAMQALSISYRAYALDLWGFGDTPNRPDKYSLDQQA